jgi:hypothetical protein
MWSFNQENNNGANNENQFAWNNNHQGDNIQHKH